MQTRGKTEPKDVPLPHVRELNRGVRDQIWGLTGVTSSIRARRNNGFGAGKKLVCTGPIAQLAMGEALTIAYIQGRDWGAAGGGGGGGDAGPWQALPPATLSTQQQHQQEQAGRRARDSGHYQFLRHPPHQEYATRIIKASFPMGSLCGLIVLCIFLAVVVAAAVAPPPPPTPTGVLLTPGELRLVNIREECVPGPSCFYPHGFCCETLRAEPRSFCSWVNTYNLLNERGIR